MTARRFRAIPEKSPEPIQLQGSVSGRGSVRHRGCWPFPQMWLWGGVQGQPALGPNAGIPAVARVAINACAQLPCQHKVPIFSAHSAEAPSPKLPDPFHG